MVNYKPGDYVIYESAGKYELGRVKRLTPHGAFVAYSEGETGALTPYDYLHRIENQNVITSLGGDYFDD